jgi:hypothetical protein
MSLTNLKGALKMRLTDNNRFDGVTRTRRHTSKIDKATPSTAAVHARSLAIWPALAASALLVFTGGAAALANPAVAATKPATLQSLGKPSVAAKCKGGSYRPATPTSPMTTISGKKWTSGFSLIGTNCDTSFSWRLNKPYSSLKATVALDASNSGPLLVQFRSGNALVKFQAGGKTVSQLKVTNNSSVVVNLGGLRQLSIVLPNPGSDAGILDVTANSLS